MRLVETALTLPPSQSKDHGLRVAVIVNDIGELNIVRILLEPTHFRL